MAKKSGLARREFLTRATATAAAAGAGSPAGGNDDPPPSVDAPTTDLDALERTVEGVLADKRLGRPVFVRYTLPQTRKARQSIAQLARMTQAVRVWVGQPLARLYAVGSLKEGPVSLTVQFRDGATALVSIVRGESHGDGVDLLVIGNHGSLHYDSSTAPAWDGGVVHPKGEPEAKLMSVIERALRSGRPEALDREG